MPDQIFADSRLAAIYDDVDGDRADLDHPKAIVAELGACSVLDVGCGTGAFGCRLAARGLTVIGVDPAQASLDVARSKDGVDRVTWLLGGADDTASDAGRCRDDDGQRRTSVPHRRGVVRHPGRGA